MAKTLLVYTIKGSLVTAKILGYCQRKHHINNIYKYQYQKEWSRHALALLNYKKQMLMVASVKGINRLITFEIRLFSKSMVSSHDSVKGLNPDRAKNAPKIYKTQ